MLFNRLVKRRRHLKKWARRTDAGAYRLYDRDIPEIPLVLDCYGTDEKPAAAGSLYRRPYEKDEDEEKIWLEAMKEAAARALETDGEQIFLRERKRQRGFSRYGRIAERRILREVREQGLLYRVNLSDYLDTGLFPDRRLLRGRVRAEAAGLSVLNLFCYTGALSVAAAAGGAARVDSVDLSAGYLERARENFALNGMTARAREEEFSPARGRLSLIRADALRFTGRALARKLRWDIIILDPPAFSNSKKMRADFDLKRDHPALVERCISLLNPGGILYLSANVRGFKLDGEILKRYRVKDITEELRDEDFRGKRVPAAYRISQNNF